MFGKKELQKELEQKEQQIQELSRKLKEYQEKNDAVVSALTDAKSAANRILGAAEARRDEIIAAAMKEKAELEAQRDGVLDKARAEAAAMIAEAEAKAKEYEKKAVSFQNYIKHTADMVRKQAENYADFLENYEHLGAGTTVDADAAPSEYKNPAELIKSIYNIEGRELPVEAKQPEEQDGGEEKLWTVDEVVSDEKDEKDEKAEKAEEEETPENGLDADLNDILNDIMKLD